MFGTGQLVGLRCPTYNIPFFIFSRKVTVIYRACVDQMSSGGPYLVMSLLVVLVTKYLCFTVVSDRSGTGTMNFRHSMIKCDPSYLESSNWSGSCMLHIKDHKGKRTKV